MSQSFDAVRERLLRAGIAPRHARRYVTELGEHLADLTAKERAAGYGAGEAAERARAVLGGDAELAQAMIARREFRSVAARAPWAVFGLLPPVVFLAMVGLLIFGLVFALRPYLGPHYSNISAMPDSYRYLISAVAFLASYAAGPLAAAGCIALALRQRSMSAWPWVGLVLVAAFSGLIGLHVHSPAGPANPHGGIMFSAAPVMLIHGRVSMAATFGMVFLRAVLLLAVAGSVYRALRRRVMAASA